MTQFRYSAARKLAAVRCVVVDGRSVCDVAREAGVSEGSLFFWVRRYRQFAPRARGDVPRFRWSSPQDAEPAREPASLVAYLRRAATR
jgi:transposase-like protein